MSYDTSEMLDNVCEQMVGHSNWAYSDNPIKGMKPFATVIFYEKELPEEEEDEVQNKKRGS